MRSFLLFSLLLAALLGLAQPGRAQAPQVQWVDGLRGTRLSLSASVGLHASTIDQAGNVYATLGYGDSVMIGGHAFATPVDSSMGISRWALIKYSPTGQVLWIKPNITSSPSGGLRIDADGNLFCYGGLTYPYTIDGNPVDRNLGMHMLTKWSPAGTLLWMQQMGSTAPNARNWPLYPTGLRIDANGDVIFSGWYGDSAQVGPFTLAQPIITMNAGNKVATGFGRINGRTGAVEWATTVYNVDSSSNSASGSMGSDASGNRYLIGNYRGTIRVGSFTSTPAPVGQSRTFWAKFNPAGQCSQLRTFESVAAFIGGAEWTRGIVAPDGYSYMINWFERPFNFGGTLLTPAAGQRDAFIARLDPNGVVQEVQPLAASLGGASWVRPLGIALDDQGRVYVSGGRVLPGDPKGQQAILAAFDQYDLRKKYWELEGGGNGEDIGGAINTAPGGQLSWSGNCISEWANIGPFQFGLAGSTDPHYQKGFVAKISQPFNLVTGEVFLDLNTNGARDAGEGPYPGSNPVVELTPGPLAAAAGPTGQYTAQVGVGSFTAAMPNPPRYHTAVQVGGTANVSFSGLGNVVTGPTFALQPIANQQDVQVILTLISPARPGNLLNYHVQYRNVGTVAIPVGNVTLTHDAQLSWESSTVAATTTGPQTLTWAYSTLQPGEARHLNVVFRLPASAVLGTVVSSTATITPLVGDVAPLDNASVADRVVTGSYDPNDIQVNHVQLNTQQVQNGEWLEYTIRFQNHGSDTAFTVAVYDSLSDLRLRLSSLQILAASHNCAWSLSPTGRLLVLFTNIRLPSQTTNAIASDGFVRFRVQPNSSLVSGDRIPNQARIHFDYNVPMATNTVLTAINGVTGLPTAATSWDQAVTVWPNPTTGTLHVEAARTESGPLHLTLLDALGRPVLTQTTEATAHTRSRATLDVRGLPTGVYVLRGQGAGQPFTQRVVVR